MKRSELSHVLRAACEIVHDPNILVIGSQSILGSFSEEQLPPDATMSIEADVAFFDDPGGTKADRVDGAIGELSPFHEHHGIYGQGVDRSTAVLPAGWSDRLVAYPDPMASPSRPRCLDPHDLVVSKLVAGREKDFVFAEVLVAAGLIRLDVLRDRAGSLERQVQQKTVLRHIDRVERAVGRRSDPA